MQRTAHALILFTAGIAGSVLLTSSTTAHADAAPARAVTATTAQFDAALEARRVRLVATLKAGQRPKLDAAIQDVLRRAQPTVVAPGKTPPPPADLAAIARSNVAPIARAENLSIEALVQIVLFEAAKSADQDLRNAVAELKAANERKAALRAFAAALKASRESTRSTKSCATFSCIDALRPSSEYSKAHIDALKLELAKVAEASREDKLTELSEAAELALASAQDRRSKYLEALSNLLKKISETSDTITQNLK